MDIDPLNSRKQGKQRPDDQHIYKWHSSNGKRQICGVGPSEAAAAAGLRKTIERINLIF